AHRRGRLHRRRPARDVRGRADVLRRRRDPDPDRPAFRGCHSGEVRLTSRRFAALLERLGRVAKPSSPLWPWLVFVVLSYPVALATINASRVMFGRDQGIYQFVAWAL